MELIYAGFEILPTNISQAMALASLAGEELVEAWDKVVKSIDADKITHKSIRALLFPPTESDLLTATIRVTPTLHETIHSEAAERGMSIPQFLWVMLQFFLSDGTVSIQSNDLGSIKNSGNSHLLQHDIDIMDYAEKEQIWREDLANLVARK